MDGVLLAILLEARCNQNKTKHMNKRIIASFFQRLCYVLLSPILFLHLSKGHLIDYCPPFQLYYSF
jgi:hypothetical protein